MTPAEKRSLTKEIKLTQEYLNDLLEQKEKQGSKHFYEFEGRKCERYMIHGDFFFPRTINKIRKELSELKLKRYPEKSTENLTKGSGWYITQDHEVCNDCENATIEQKKQLILLGFTEKFKMFDDDGVLYYSGLAKPDIDFEPLDYFGMPNAGCTSIKYFDSKTKKYQTL